MAAMSPMTTLFMLAVVVSGMMVLIRISLVVSPLIRLG